MMSRKQWSQFFGVPISPIPKPTVRLAMNAYAKKHGCKVSEVDRDAIEAALLAADIKHRARHRLFEQHEIMKCMRDYMEYLNTIDFPEQSIHKYINDKITHYFWKSENV